ncbi:uncharacterized protein TNCV_1089451 [Trichonephila clavipes]|uniref:Uncharacterized protein n=1 Tax=Trichonephila clavipes TaxID=2585209 RepID=A0A8X6VQE9_TRICX|nr:uncharacterized protein TNCV_1089451 [Trichonephila clavipes]
MPAIILYLDHWVTAAPMPFPRGASTRGLLAIDLVILNHDQVTWTTPELAPPLLTTTPHQREDVSALDRFNVHRSPTRRVFRGCCRILLTDSEVIIGSMGTTNQHITWGQKTRLADENRNNSSREKDDEPDEGISKRMRGFGAPW